jgi:guanylate kinase
MKNKGMLIVISAPAGCGKDTIIKGLFDLGCIDNLFYSVSATTRRIRPGETDGTHYYFKNHREFEWLIQQGEFLEYTEYCGNYYGTIRKTVESRLEQGMNIILKIEIEGATTIRRLFPDCVTVFILPPSFEELRRRLQTRSTEDEATMELRIKKSLEEFELCKDYDYRVTNDVLEVAINEVADIIRAERAKRDAA